MQSLLRFHHSLEFAIIFFLIQKLFFKEKYMLKDILYVMENNVEMYKSVV